MRRKLYKIFLAFKGYKLLDADKYFLFTYDITMKQFVFWYIESDGLIRILNVVKKPLDAKFKWNILIKRGKSYVNN